MPIVLLKELPYGGVAAGETNHVAEVLLEGVTQPLLITNDNLLCAIV